MCGEVTMMMRKNGFHKHSATSVYVLDGYSPARVARAMIEGGRQKESFHVFDMDEAYRRIQHFKKLLPRVQIFYAMKANDCELMLKLAASQGLGFDCASPGEIYKIRQLNVSPLSIVYAMPAKTPEQMMYARLSGVKHTTFDTLYELKNIKEYWPDARLLIRLRVDSDSLYKLGEKFGCDFETEAIDLLEKAASLELKVAGVAFHVGSGCYSIDSYEVGLQQAKALFEYEERAGRQMKILDIGGGLFNDGSDRIIQVSNLINSRLEQLFPDPSIQVIAEPGRYICESAFKLYCNINSIRRGTRDNKPIDKIYINDGVFGTLRSSDPWHTVHKFKRTAEKINSEVIDTVIFGPSGDADDRVMRDYSIRLPQCKPSDWLVFGVQGAYTFVFSSKFSCLEIPLMRFVISTDLWKKIKQCPVFNETDFMLNPDISAPMPSTLPHTIPTEDTTGHCNRSQMKTHELQL